MLRDSCRHTKYFLINVSFEISLSNLVKVMTKDNVDMNSFGPKEKEATERNGEKTAGEVEWKKNKKTKGMSKLPRNRKSTNLLENNYYYRLRMKDIKLYKTIKAKKENEKPRGLGLKNQNVKTKAAFVRRSRWFWRKRRINKRARKNSKKGRRHNKKARRCFFKNLAMTNKEENDKNKEDKEKTTEVL